ncbi:MAG: hypothetical protein KFF73_00295 [Cyclobacteriaceae bacterium]|nr:hypothetical protein [Cyclobacteriaceae bacterium]
MKKDMFKSANGNNGKTIIPELRSFYTCIAILMLFYFAGCDKSQEDPDSPDICLTDPCGNPEECPGQCPDLENGIITKNTFKAEGNVVETENSMSVVGSLTITTTEEKEIVLDDAEITVEYNDDGSVKSMEGTAIAPSPTDYIEFAEPVQADLGYYSGKYLNENWDLEVRLVDDRFYLAFRIAIALELKVGTNSDPNSTKPFSIKPPVGGHILYIFDYTDPFYFYSAAQDVLGSMSFGESFEGNIPYEPIQPVEKIIAFNGKSVRSGTYTIFKVIEAKGTMIQGTEFNLELIEKDPFPLNFSAGYSAGVNGEFELSLPIASWITFNIPMGEGSAAITAEASNEGVKAQAFINGLAKPDNSWWPDLIPVKPGGQIRNSGYVQQDGHFDLELSGDFNLVLPSKTYAVEGIMSANNESFTMAGNVLANDLTWEASAEFRKGETTFRAKPPQELIDDIDNLVNSNIDSAITKAETALADLEKATADYELELSLRGLRSSIPVIVSEAKKRIADEIAAGVKSGKDQANKILNENNLALCGDNISQQVNKVDDPYIKALDRLNQAASATNDNETTRAEIEGALRDLAKLNRLSTSVTVTVTAGNKAVNNPWPVPDISKCSIFSDDYTRTIKIDVQVLTAEQVALITEAADNVKYIAETSDIKIEIEEILARIPSKEIMDQLKQDIQNGTKSIPSIEEVGFIQYYPENTFSYYWIANGEKTDLAEVDIFDPASISRAIMDGLIE